MTDCPPIRTCPPGGRTSAGARSIRSRPVDGGRVVGWLRGHHPSESWGHLTDHRDSPDGKMCSCVTHIFTAPPNAVGVRQRVANWLGSRSMPAPPETVWWRADTTSVAPRCWHRSTPPSATPCGLTEMLSLVNYPPGHCRAPEHGRDHGGWLGFGPPHQSFSPTPPAIIRRSIHGPPPPLTALILPPAATREPVPTR